MTLKRSLLRWETMSSYQWASEKEPGAMRIVGFAMSERCRLVESVNAT